MNQCSDIMQPQMVVSTRGKKASTSLLLGAPESEPVKSMMKPGILSSTISTAPSKLSTSDNDEIRMPIDHEKYIQV